jgi:hypothetical protein
MLSKNEASWQIIFEHLGIIREMSKNGYYKITADQIKQIGKREPRLMTKFDSSYSLPEIFKKHKISILPISRNSYVLSFHEIYHKLTEPTKNVVYVKQINHFDTLKLDSTTESQAINLVYNNGILEDFLKEYNLYPTSSGKQTSGNFNFFVNNIKTKRTDFVDVNNSQIEIDAVYENKDCVVIIEAKTTLPEDFLVRQLYFPLRRISSKTNKKVRLVYLVFNNFYFYLFEYKYNDINYYNSLKLVNDSIYTFTDNKIEKSFCTNIVTKLKNNTSVPFPQANDIRRILELVLFVGLGSKNKDDVTMFLRLDKRQTDYYLNACLYLELLSKNNGLYFLNKDRVKGLETNQLVKVVVKRVLSNGIFFKVFENFDQNSLNVRSVYNFIKDDREFTGLNKTTINRRASTIVNWVKWINKVIDR